MERIVSWSKGQRREEAFPWDAADDRTFLTSPECSLSNKSLLYISLSRLDEREFLRLRRKGALTFESEPPSPFNCVISYIWNCWPRGSWITFPARFFPLKRATLYNKTPGSPTIRELFHKPVGQRRFAEMLLHELKRALCIQEICIV